MYAGQGKVAKEGIQSVWLRTDYENRGTKMRSVRNGSWTSVNAVNGNKELIKQAQLGEKELLHLLEDRVQVL